MSAPVIEALDAAGLDRELQALAGLLQACVQAGASINFVLPYELDDSRAFWTQRVRPALAAGTRLLLATRLDGEIAGSVQLDLAWQPNQAHRAEVSKLIVHPERRRRGLARALMLDLERRAAGLGRSLITLDTRSGDAAEPLYRGLGYVAAGAIPGFARAPDGERLEPTTIMYKTL